MQHLLMTMAFGFGFGVVSAIPTGPVAVLILKNSVQQGAKAGLVTLASLMAAELVYVLLFALGLGDLVLQTNWIRIPLSVAGGALLVFLGAQALREKSVPPSEEEGSSDKLRAMFRDGFLVTITNPALLLIYATLLASASGVLGESVAVQYRVALLVSMWIGVGGWFVVLVFVVSRLPERLATPIRRWISSAAGLALAGFGAWLLVGVLREVLSGTGST